MGTPSDVTVLVFNDGIYRCAFADWNPELPVLASVIIRGARSVVP
jgi:hypothetical protein